MLFEEKPMKMKIGLIGFDRSLVASKSPENFFVFNATGEIKKCLTQKNGFDMDK
jgi:hypothetical protein